MERSINGDLEAFSTLSNYFPPKTIKHVTHVVLPPKPPLHLQQPEKGIYRAISLRFPSKLLPLLIFPSDQKNFRQRDIVRRKLDQLRLAVETRFQLELYIYHLLLEETFLKEVLGVEQVSCGVQETRSMVFDIREWISNVVMYEDNRVLEGLKMWVGMYPNVRYLPTGIREGKEVRKERIRWRRRVIIERREAERKAKREEEMRRWKRRYDGEVVYERPRMRRIKRVAKKLRRRKMMR